LAAPWPRGPAGSDRRPRRGAQDAAVQQATPPLHVAAVRRRATSGSTTGGAVHRGESAHRHGAVCTQRRRRGGPARPPPLRRQRRQRAATDRPRAPKRRLRASPTEHSACRRRSRRVPPFPAGCGRRPRPPSVVRRRPHTAGGRRGEASRLAPRQPATRCRRQPRGSGRQRGAATTGGAPTTNGRPPPSVVAPLTTRTRRSGHAAEPAPRAHPSAATRAPGPRPPRGRQRGSARRRQRAGGGGEGQARRPPPPPRAAGAATRRVRGWPRPPRRPQRARAGHTPRGGRVDRSPRVWPRGRRTVAGRCGRRRPWCPPQRPPAWRRWQPLGADRAARRPARRCQPGHARVVWPQRHTVRDGSRRARVDTRAEVDFHIIPTYCCLPNFGRCGRSQDSVSVNCPLADPLYPAEWMAETQFRTVDHPS